MCNKGVYLLVIRISVLILIHKTVFNYCKLLVAVKFLTPVLLILHQVVTPFC